jgi:tRNA(His) 5'-end guanylyltransferase
MKKEKSRFDALGDRMKKYERMETNRTLMPGLPIMVRLDGRGFSKFTRGMTRPFHEPMSRAMIETARYLVEETHASFAYTQSDEITLGFWSDDPKNEPLFGGRVQKLVSVYAGMATSKFMEQTMLRMPGRVKRLPVLDARVFNMPNLDEMAECVLFRALECAKNSITMAASAYYPHRELHGKSGGVKHEMLHAKGINWADYPEFFKNGTFLRRETATAEVSAERMARIPEKHRHLHTGKASRSSVVEAAMPPFARVANPVEVLFYGAAPILRSDVASLAAA